MPRRRPRAAIVLAPTDAPTRATRGLEGRYLTRLLDGIPMVTGDRVRVNPIGTQMRNFVVTKAAPAGPVIVTPTTTITCEGGGERRREAVTYEDIGGLHKEVRRVARSSSCRSNTRRCSPISASTRRRAFCSTARRAPARR